MTLYTTLNTFEGVEPSLDQPSVGEYLGAVATETWNSNPLQATTRAYQLAESIAGGVDVDDSEGGFPNIRGMQPRTQQITLEEQSQRIKDAGLEGHLKPTQGYTEEALAIVTQRKHEELAIQEIRNAAPMSYAPLGLAAGLGVSLLDPVNVATAFFPAVPEARALSFLRRASGAWGRAGVRAGLGAAEGALGAALVEPVIYGSKTFEQADYEMLDSAMNIGFGAIFSAALRPAAGAIGERLRSRAGMRQPWEIAASTDATESLRNSFSQEMQSALTQARPDLEAGAVREISQAAAAIWDARARTWAYDLGRSAEEYYQRYRPEFQADLTAQVGENNLAQAMYPARETSLSGFSERVRREGPQADKSYFAFSVPGELEDMEFRLPSDTALHQSKRHPDMTLEDIDTLPAVLAQLNSENTIAASRKGLHGTPFLGQAEINGTSYGVAFEAARNGNVYVTTFFKDSPKRLRNWLGQEKQKASKGPAASATESHKKPGVTPGKPSIKTLRQMLEEVKSGDAGALNQAVFHGNPKTPRASISFVETEAKAVISFFSATDPTSAPHELYHIFRRELAETASDAAAPARVREQWRQIEEFVGATPEKPWTAEMEEKFAKAGERFLLEGKTPAPALTGVFERLRQWFLEIYGNAEGSGLPISEEMRRVFGDMLAMPMQDADQAFRYALGDMISRDVSQEFRTSAGEPMPLETADAATLRELTEQSAVDLQENLKGVAASEPKLAAAIDAEYAPQFAQADADMARAQMYRAVLEEAALCEARR